MKRYVGLTGPTGAGKSSVSRVLAACGLDVIDCDAVSRSAVEPGSVLLPQLAESFGGDVLLPDGSLNRRLLASRAFADAEHTSLLNSIMLPHIAMLIDLLATKCVGDVVVLDAPTLFESGIDKKCVATVAVVAPRDELVRRIMERDSISLSAANQRLNAQHDCGFFEKNCTYVIHNTGSPASLEEQARHIAGKIKNL